MLVKDAIHTEWIRNVVGTEKAEVLLCLGAGFGHGLLSKHLGRWKDLEKDLYLFDVALIARHVAGLDTHSLYIIYYAGLACAIFETAGIDPYRKKKQTCIVYDDVFAVAMGVLARMLMDGTKVGRSVRQEEELPLLKRCGELVIGKVT